MKISSSRRFHKHSTKIKTWYLLALVFCAVLLAYYPVLSAPLNSLDDVRLANHLMNQADFSWRDYLIPTASSYYRPLINSSFILDKILWGMESPLMHLENVILHLINTLLVFALACQLSRFKALKGVGMPTVAALIFGLHPINVEAVAWISGRADLLAGTFVLITLYCFWSYLSDHNPLWLLAAVSSFFLGTLAKETALFVLPGLFLLAWGRSRPPLHEPLPFWRALPKLTLSIGPFVVASAIYFLLRSWALHGRDLGLRHVVNLSTVQNADSISSAVAGTPVPQTFPLKPLLLKAEALVTISGFYAKKLFWPFPLNFGIIDVPDGYFWVGIALLFTAIVLFRRKTIAGSLALTAMSLGSIALLVALGDISWTPVAERYMYAPAAVLTLSCMLTCSDTVSSGSYRFLLMIVSALLIVFFAGTFQRSLIWQDNVKLFADTVEKSPEFTAAKNGLAMALLAKGKQQEAYDILRDLELPDFQVASLNRIMVLAAEGQLEEARSLLLERLQTESTYETIVHLKLVGVLERLVGTASTDAQAREYQREALYYLDKVWKRTGDPFFLYRKGQMQMALGDHNGARDSFSLAAKLLPEDSLYKEPASKLARSIQ